MSVENYKNVIIGSGEGGKYLAWHLAQSGQQTVVVERRWVGGSCPNVNCLPSKNEIWSAKVADLVHHATRFGITLGSPASDMAAVRKRKREMVEGLIAMHLDRYKASGVELVMGEAKFTGPKTLDVRLNDGGTRTLTGERIFLNLGTHPSIPSVPGLAESGPLTNIEVLELDRLPEHLLVLGGGYVGLEFAQAYRRFGSRVTILERGSQLLANEDPDVTAALLQIFASDGIDVIAPAEIVSVHGLSGTVVSLIARTSSGEKTITGSDILVATGRAPNTAGIGLEVAGVELDQRGYVKANDRLQATAPNVWVIGECAGSPQFTHISLDDFLFTDPQVAHVGITETEAGRQGIAVRVLKLPMAAVLRTRTIDESRGFMKALIEADGDRILGFTMIGPEAGEVMAVVQMAMLAELPYTALRDAILTHPTMAEGLNSLFSSLKQTNAGAASLRGPTGSRNVRAL